MGMPAEYHIENLIAYTKIIENAPQFAEEAAKNVHPSFQTFTYGYEEGVRRACDMVIEHLRETLIKTGEITLTKEEL